MNALFGGCKILRCIPQLQRCFLPRYPILKVNKFRFNCRKKSSRRRHCPKNFLADSCCRLSSADPKHDNRCHWHIVTLDPNDVSIYIQERVAQVPLLTFGSRVSSKASKAPQDLKTSAWRKGWDKIAPFFDFAEEIRSTIYISMPSRSVLSTGDDQIT